MSATLTRYRVKAERVEEHQRLLDAVFAELEATGADGFTLKVFRVDDDVTFLHVVIDHDEVDRTGYLDDLPTYRTFIAGLDDRCREMPESSQATVVGGWR